MSNGFYDRLSNDNYTVISPEVLKLYLSLSNKDKTKISNKPMTELEIIKTGILDDLTHKEVIGKFGLKR